MASQPTSRTTRTSSKKLVPTVVRAAKGLPVADYTIGADYIYISVGWSDANALVKIVGQMAWTQRLAVAYVSEDSSIFRP